MPPHDRKQAEPQTLQCMGVWGGYESTYRHLTRPGLDLWIWSKSAGSTKQSGGDLHLITSCASGRITRSMLADICGFGSLPATIAKTLRDLMKGNANSLRHKKLVQNMAAQFREASEHGALTNSLIASYFAPTKSLSICNAGFPKPLLYRADSDAWSEAQASVDQPPGVETRTSLPTQAETDSAAGVFSSNDYQHASTKLKIGDMFFAYSNAFTECRDARGRSLGVTGMLERLNSSTSTDPKTLASCLAARIQAEHNDNLSATDATILIGLATKKSVSLKDNFLAPFRLLRPVSDQTNV